MEKEIDLEVGDRVTYNYYGNQIIEIIVDIDHLKNMLEELKDGGVQILKIERPKYEVVEEKKELLTEEEREFLRLYAKIMKIEITEIEKENNSKIFIWDYGTNYEFEIEDKIFSSLINDKRYTAKELGLEE